MDIRELQPGYAVSPQIEPGDMPALKAAGFGTVICNRPDAENPPERRSDVMREAAEAAGLTFVFNPISPGQFTPDIIDLQRETLEASDQPVFAYCASGNRSSVIWALGQAGRQDADTLIGAAAKWGYQLEPIRPHLESRG